MVVVVAMCSHTCSLSAAIWRFAQNLGSDVGWSFRIELKCFASTRPKFVSVWPSI